MSETRHEQMTVNQMMNLISETYTEFDEALDAIPSEHLTEPIMGEWTPKDIIAHVTWSEREMVQVLKSRVLAGSALWNKTQDERNQAVFDENRDRSLAEVMNDHIAVHSELIGLIEQLTDAEINDPATIAELPPGVNPWRLLMGNTWKHYSEHAADLRAAMDGDAA